MKQLIKLAWKNIWRKKRRSVIAITSVSFAVFLAISFRSLQWGSYEKMIEAGVKNTGYVQVHAENYWEDKSINDLLEVDDKLLLKMKSVDGVKAIIPRLQNYTLASGPRQSKGVSLIGISPEAENDLNGLTTKVIEGNFISSETGGAMLGQGLADYLELGIGDTLVLFGQGNYGTVAAGKYPVEAILQFTNPQQNKSLVYLGLTTAQDYNSAFGKVSALMIDVSDQKLISEIAKDLKEQLGNDFEIMSWDELQPGIQDSINTDTAIATMLLSCLYLIVGFGVIGTIVMMALERKREFGMLQANGMQKPRIQGLIIIESIFMGLIGVMIAFIAAGMVVSYMHYNPIPLSGEAARSFEAMGAEPIIQFAVKPDLFLKQGLIVFAIMMIASLFPVYLVKNLKISQAIR